MSNSWFPFTLALVLSVGCKSEGSFSGDLSESKQPSSAPAPSKAETTTAPPAKHERVPFDWQSGDGGRSGNMQTTLPTGETFSGQFHQITETTEVASMSGFHSLWYGDPWHGPAWAWDGSWPYYPPEDFVRYYTGRVVAVLNGDQGKSMRCHFRLDHPNRGMDGGGQGDCQVSNGDHITAVFAAS